MFSYKRVFGAVMCNLHGVIDPIEIDSAPVIDPMSNATANWSHKAGDFDVIYIPEKSGVYEIRVFCGNIPLNGDNPFKKNVTPGAVNVSLSGVVKYKNKVSKLVKN